ncbi:MAG: membrane protein insertion efficiency factor YidD [Melioribacteraceae bacterium]
MKFILYISFLVSFSPLFAQTDWERWDAKDASYENQSVKIYSNNSDGSGFGMTILSGLKNSYDFFISDLDGDNCAFAPSCSAFFLQAVKESGIIKGTLMFADRFTRDINFFKGSNKYILLQDRKYYDPSYNYLLRSEKIKF